MSVPRAPHPALIAGWVIGACLVGAGLILLDRPLLSHLLLTGYLMVLGPWLALRVRRGRAMAGVDQTVPAALLLWATGHLAEVYRLRDGAPFAAPLVPADLLFLVVGLLVAVAATGVLWRSAHHLRLRSVIRSTLDSLLLALAAILVFWHWVAAPLVQHPNPIAFALSLSYLTVCTVMATSLVIRAVQRLEPGAWLLAFSGSVPAIGIGFWSLAKLGVGNHNDAIGLFMAGALVLPLALTHPGHQQEVTVREGGHRENLWPVGLHLGAWGVFYLTLGEEPLDRVTLTLTIVSVASLFLRIFLVRLSERSLYEQLRTMAFTDSLTGAANRRGLLERLAALPRGWLVSIDLDGFKQVNDEYGHDVGDRVLLDYVSRCQTLLPPGALLARVGGDEFAVIGPGPLAEGARVAEALVRTARVLAHQGVTASAGVAEHQSGTDTAGTLRDADIALQWAKQSGKNRVEKLDAQMKARRLRELTMVQRLRENMAEAIHLHFQPIVAISHPLAPTVAVEALARWDDAVLGQVPPAEFVDVCERNGLIGELGAVVLDKTLRQLEQWVQIGTPLQATINVSWLQLRDDACMLRMQETIAGQPHLARWLVIEVTEGVLADDDEAVAYLQELRNLGVILAIDDFGTGASTLTRLRHLPVDVLKIDRMLLQGIGEDPGADSVLSLVQQLGNSLGLAVVVEGVETHEARNRLVELGFELAQGFYFNRPLPAHQVPLSNGVDPMLNRRELPLPTQS